MSEGRRSPLRGELFWVELPEIGRKPALVVSNNVRNERTSDVVVARVTSAPKPDIATVVALADHSGAIAGRVLCDSLHTVPQRHLVERAGALPRRTMDAVDRGLALALGLTSM